MLGLRCIGFVELMISVRAVHLSSSMHGRPKDERTFCNADVNHHYADKKYTQMQN